MRQRLRRREALVIGVLLLSAAAIAGLAFEDSSGGSSVAPAPVPAQLPGQLIGPAPWPRNTELLGPRLAALQLPALAVEGTVLHTHQHLDVFVSGRRVIVPAGIGIDPAGRFISPLHTHDTTGVIHVESPTVRHFTLGEFFGVWGVRFGPGHFGGYVAGGGRALHTYVNGRQVAGDPGRLLLAQHQEIVVAFGTKAQLPHPLPTSYQFAPGL